MYRVSAGVPRVFQRSTLLTILISIGVVAGAASPSSNSRAEIAHLLSYLETSRCEFYRNGTWYDSKEARAHLEKKYAYLMNRTLIGNAEDFIELAATGSSVSGKPYQVRCRPNASVPSGVWLRAELERFRARSTTGGDSSRAKSNPTSRSAI